MNRYLTEPIKEDLKRKMILLMGLGQVGKTTLAQNLGNEFCHSLLTLIYCAHIVCVNSSRGVLPQRKDSMIANLTVMRPTKDRSGMAIRSFIDTNILIYAEVSV
jgi:hypothetical protein